jgi:hypothetical protein
MWKRQGIWWNSVICGERGGVAGTIDGAGGAATTTATATTGRAAAVVATRSRAT